MNKQNHKKTAQEIQDEIFRHMPVGRKILLTGRLSKLCLNFLIHGRRPSAQDLRDEILRGLTAEERLFIWSELWKEERKYVDKENRQLLPFF